MISALIEAALAPPLKMISSFLNISTPGFSSFIDVNTGILNDLFTALQILPHAEPYLPALKAGPAKNISTSLSLMNSNILLIASS